MANAPSMYTREEEEGWVGGGGGLGRRRRRVGSEEEEGWVGGGGGLGRRRRRVGSEEEEGWVGGGGGGLGRRRRRVGSEEEEGWVGGGGGLGRVGGGGGLGRRKRRVWSEEGGGSRVRGGRRVGRRREEGRRMEEGWLEEGGGSAGGGGRIGPEEGRVSGRRRGSIGPEEGEDRAGGEGGSGWRRGSLGSGDCLPLGEDKVPVPVPSSSSLPTSFKSPLPLSSVYICNRLGDYHPHATTGDDETAEGEHSPEGFFKSGVVTAVSGVIVTGMERSVKSVIITSNGDDISKNIAYHLAKYGCRLVLMGDEVPLRSIAKEIMEALKGSSSIEVIGLDMSDHRAITFEEAVDKACKRLGALDAFVNCYIAEGEMQEALDMPEDEFKKTTQIHFMSPWFLAVAVGKKMRDFGSGGSIIFLSTIIGAERGLYPGAAAFGSCLAGIKQLVRTLALEVGKYKIRVNAIARGLHVDDKFPLSVGKEKAMKSTKDVMPLLRWLDVEKDLHSTVHYLVGDESGYLTGTTIFVDGGQSLVRPRMRSFM
ncbi:hypothetical protein H6P81_013516 [Aristolochia fimbriata]|uniref:Uncharacterized protein n=1 Tax=Aristolochia fimbriata TaxID=158543 RepID=A0AAV7EF67_ARIFI|nr:hypothetical protein H6P81_013516 [Aristolochia fimbriata]